MLLSEVEYAAFLSYSPRGATEAARESRDYCRALKDERLVGPQRVPMSRLVASRLRARLPETPFADWFGTEVVLVPVPKSGLMKPGDLWVPYLVAKALVDVGLGRDVLPCLSRRHAVRKSATSPAGERARPAEHYESMRVDRAFPEPSDLLLVDDIVTRGATLLEAASRLREAFPDGRIRAFAVMRTISDPDKFEAVLAPVVGRMRLSGGNAFRAP